MAKPLRVLIVDDSHDDALLITIQLSRGGYEISYQRVETAGSMMDSLKQTWDVIICDHVMPQFDAPAALKIAKEKSPQTPFIILSGHLNDDTAREIINSGARDYITKDDMARLLPVIERELQRL